MTWWELLNCQLTCDVYCTPRLLRNIQRIGHSITIHSNAGKSSTNLVGEHPEHGWVWYDPKGIANILSLKRMSRKHRITYDSEGTGTLRDAFVVHRGNSPLRFAASATGLYYRNAANDHAAGVTLTSQGVATT